MEIAWPALTVACLRPTTSAFRREPTASEAASSLAEITRLPADSLARELVAAESDMPRLRCATLAAKLEIRLRGIVYSYMDVRQPYGYPGAACSLGVSRL